MVDAEHPSRLPDFLGVGAPKAGSTTLHAVLAEHPAVFVPEATELHFFTHRQIRSAAAGPLDGAATTRLVTSMEEYRAAFRGSDGAAAVGEVSPSYLYHESCHEEIARTLPGVRCIAVVRNPVDRAFSNWVHQRRIGAETLSFADALRAEEQRRADGWGDFWRYADHSRYVDRLNSLAGAVGRQNLLVLAFPDVVGDPGATQERLWRFLGVEAPAAPIEGVHRNPGGWIPTSRVARWIERPSRWKPVAKKLVPTAAADAFRRTRDRRRAGAERPRLDRWSHDHLGEVTAYDTAALAADWGIDVAESRYAADLDGS
jgi:Sulfotransferase family